MFANRKFIATALGSVVGFVIMLSAIAPTYAVADDPWHKPAATDSYVLDDPWH